MIAPLCDTGKSAPPLVCPRSDRALQYTYIHLKTCTVTTKTSAPHSRFLSPGYWHIWLGTGLLWLLNRLPLAVQIRLGRVLGRLLYLFNRKRRHVTEVNVRLCFPELTKQEQKQLVRRILENNGIGMFETAMAWWSPASLFADRTHLKGREHLDAALAKGKGVLLLGAHFSTLDLGGLLFAQHYPVDAMYRRHNNDLMEQIITRGRSRYFGQSIERSDIRSVIRALRKNHIIWYAPDQDFGRKHSVFARFFGVQASTITATARLARLNGSPILMLAQHRLSNGHYELELFPVLEGFPSGDDEADAQRINDELEKAIRKDPSQYMWVHRRFKTQPDGKARLYKQDRSH